MTAQYRLLEDAEHFERTEQRLTLAIEEAEKNIVDLRLQRDEARLHRAEARAAAQLLDAHGFRVERNEAGVITVSVDPETGGPPMT